MSILVQQINSACQKLQIACLESSVKQLEILKKSQLLPTGAPNCGLLTQTNAERLCAYLMDNTLSQSTPPQLSPNHYQHHKQQKLKVVHECFGKTYGHLHMSLYARSDSACVECDTCHKFYTPKNFVCHSHKYESNIRHWGFDSENWRIYLKLANSSAHIVSSHSAEQHSSSILSDKSNKDNISANIAASNKSFIQQEEFEQFKKKFLYNAKIKEDAKELEGMKRKIEEDIKQSRQFSAQQQHHQSKHSLLNNSYSGVENSAKRLMTSSLSLNDLNNNLIKNAITNSTNPNTKSLNEHKLLNGLLSKPLNEQNSQVSQHQNNLLIPSSANGNMSLEQIMKLNKLNSMQQQQQQQQQRTGNLTKHYEEMYSKSAGQVTPNQNSLLHLINNGSEQKKQSTQQSKLESSPSAAPTGILSKMMGQHNSNISSMESNMLDLIINEIDQCVENKESAERLRQMISQMHLYFNEKLNELQTNRNKLVSEFDEVIRD